jgi:signal transduction histidine kinase
LAFNTLWATHAQVESPDLSYGSFLLLLVAGTVLAYYFSYRRFRRDRGVSEALRDAASFSEGEVVLAVEAALQRLTRWMSCSGAILAVWDEELDYDAICVYPPNREPDEEASARLETSQDWACFRGSRLDFVTNDLYEVDRSGNRVARDFDLHPFIIQKFEIYNCIGLGLKHGGKPIGRLLLYNSISDVRRAHWRELQEIEPYLRGVVRHLLALKRTEIEAFEYEGERIAHDLHDGPLQSMISFEMRLEIIRRLIHRTPDVAVTELESLQQFSRKLVAEMRTFVHRMRPIETDSSSLLAAARRLVDGFQKESGVPVTFVNGQNGDLSLSSRQSTELLQVVREALNNIYKHAQATHVVFSVERKNQCLYVSVHDNGRGFRFGGRFSLEELELMRMGPRSIKQRIRAMGGDLSLESHPGQGSNLRVSVPLD